MTNNDRNWAAYNNAVADFRAAVLAGDGEAEMRCYERMKKAKDVIQRKWYMAGRGDEANV